MPEATRRRYYHGTGVGHDDLLRCQACQRLVKSEDLRRRGHCACGNSRVTEIRTLSLWEWCRIRLGLIKTRHRREFLQEFGLTR